MTGLRTAIAGKWAGGSCPKILRPRTPLHLSDAKVSHSVLVPLQITRDLTRPVAPPVVGRDVARDAGFAEPRITDTDVGRTVPCTQERTDAVLLTSLVSDNLLTPIGSPDPRGKNYAVVSEQTALFPDQERQFKSQRQERRRSYVERRTRTAVIRMGLGLWDMILPLLRPPIDFDFPSQLDFPSALYPFQVEGVQRLVANKSFLLGDDMGTGKTVMSTVAMRILFHQGLVRRALVVAPANVISVWQEHLEDWGGTELSFTIAHGSPPDRRKLDWQCRAHVYVTSYATLRNDILADDPVLGEDDLRKFDIVILDEIHHIRNPQSKAARAARKLTPEYRWGLSGTPLQNKLDDLTAIFRFVNSGLPLAETRSIARVQKLIGPYFLRRRKKDVLKQLPEKVSQNLWIGLDPEQRAAYEEALTTGRQQFADRRTPFKEFHVFALLQKLKQICNFAPSGATSPKLELLLDQLDVIAKEHKAVVFTQYIQQGVEKLRPALARYGFVEITGKTPSAQRTRLIDSFQRDPEVRVFLGSTRAAGEGITLTEGNYVFHFDHWWNPATARQAEDRVHRIGQKRQVNVYHYWTENTIEERIYEILQRKGLLYAEVIDAMSEEDIDRGISMEDWCEVLGLDVTVAREAAPTGRPTDAVRSLGQVYESLAQLPPQEFEMVVASAFRRLGYANAKVTGQAYDGGVDIRASKNTVGGPERIVIQCKRKAQVGVDVARELMGVVAADHRISRGFLVVSGKLSGPCRDFIRQQGNLSSIEGVELAKRIVEFDIRVPPE